MVFSMVPVPGLFNLPNTIFLLLSVMLCCVMLKSLQGNTVWPKIVLYSAGKYVENAH